MQKTVKVKQDKDNYVVPVEILAEEAKAISFGIKKLLAGPLKRKTLLLLIQNSAPSIHGKKLSMSQIDVVLAGIESLEKDHLKQ